jgi:hypothetical protein
VSAAAVAALAVAMAASTAVPAAGQTAGQAGSPPRPIRTFVVAKPVAPETVPESSTPGLAAPVHLPVGHESLRATLGLGYVEGADWGGILTVGGTVAGVHLQLDSLMSTGTAGTRLDRGTLLVSDPDRGWRLAAGDLFSDVRGVSRGAKLSWSARGDRRPSVAVYGAAPGAPGAPTVLAYRDQLRLGRQTPLDAEVASDRSWAAASRWAIHPLEFEASYRHRATERASDLGFALGSEVWRGVRVYGSWLRSSDEAARADWRSVAVRVPVGRWLDVTVERAFAQSGGVRTSTSAVMAGAGAGRFRFFHRQQWGETRLGLDEFDAVIAREQYQSMATYSTGPRLNLTMQLATAWTGRGRAEHWQELAANVAVTRTTSLQMAAAVPDLANADRLRVRVTQALPAQFAVLAEFGRVSAFQSLRPGDDRPRARLMLSRSWSLRTPARGGQVSGRVIDHAGHPVAGARVTLGPYAVTSGPDGAYLFRPLPRGEYDLALDGQFLPADYAWDGQRQHVSVDREGSRVVDLRVTPLNAIHGRVWVDLDANGRFDAGEAVAHAVVRLGDRVTATGLDGAYAFYNLWPGEYAITLDAARLPPDYAAGSVVAIPVGLRDDRPVIGADFQVARRTKPIVWRQRIGGSGR